MVDGKSMHDRLESAAAPEGASVETLDKGVTRRGFIQGASLAALGTAAFGLAGCGAPADQGKYGQDAAAEGGMPDVWDFEADVVIVGAGAVGLMAANRARDLGASVIVVEANYAAGGHALTSGGHVHLGGGTSVQKANGVTDSADQYYIDHTKPFETRDSRNIREVVRGAADVHAETFEYLLSLGWTHLPISTLRGGGTDSVPRTITSDVEPWSEYNPLGAKSRVPAGIGLTRPMEASAREKGVQFIMNHHMDKLFRAEDGNVVGVEASYQPRLMPGSSAPLVDFEDFLDGNIASEDTVRVRAAKGVVIATGGSTSNWEFHSILDSRYGPEHANGVGGCPFSFQDGSGEAAALAIGASLGAVNVGIDLAKARAIGCQFGYRHKTVGEDSPLWPLVRAYGFDVDTDRVAEDGLIYVNMLGERFAAEDASEEDYWEALLGSAVVKEDGKAKRLAGPVWAIFDEDWRTDRGWKVAGRPDVDREEGYFFSGDTLGELAGKIVNKFYEQHKMPPANLEATVARYNSFVESGVDEDFGRKNPQHKIQTPPFYAAWCPNAFHDCLIGLLINEKFQVMDFNRQPIGHLYCGGEASAGQGMHGHGKNLSNGYAIATNVMKESAI
jgi:hypothetical protein